MDRKAIRVNDLSDVSYMLKLRKAISNWLRAHSFDPFEVEANKR